MAAEALPAYAGSRSRWSSGCLCNLLSGTSRPSGVHWGGFLCDFFGGTPARRYSIMRSTKSLTSGETSTPSVAMAAAVRRPSGFAAQKPTSFQPAVTAGSRPAPMPAMAANIMWSRSAVFVDFCRNIRPLRQLLRQAEVDLTIHQASVCDCDLGR